MIAQYEKMMNILMILEVLKRHTDSPENSLATQKEIADKVEKEYGVRIDRHAVKRNLENLERFLDYSDCGYVLLHGKEAVRTTDGEEEVIRSDWYIERDITDAELHLLIDGLLFSKYIPYIQCKKLVENLEKLSSRHFRRRRALPENQPENKHLLLTVEVLCDAIANGKKVEFQFVAYGTDKKPQVVTQEDGSARVYKVSPYEIVVTNGRYYLICAHNKGELFHYRLDYIRNARMTGERRRLLREVPGCEHGLDLSCHMKEHIYMYGGGSTRVTFRANLCTNQNIVGHIIDWFGNEVRFSSETEDSVTATVNVSEQAMFYWALQYGESVEVLKPASLRDKLYRTANEMREKYSRAT